MLPKNTTKNFKAYSGAGLLTNMATGAAVDAATPTYHEGDPRLVQWPGPTNLYPNGCNPWDVIE